MDEINAALTEDELSFCISTLELEIRESKEELHTKGITADDRRELTTYINKLTSLKQELEQQAQTLKSFDLLHLYQLIQKERALLGEMLDTRNLVGEQRANAQSFLRTANSLTRKLKAFFKGFGIEV